MKIKSILLAFTMLFFVGITFAADKVVEVKLSKTKVEKATTLEAKKSLPGGTSTCTVTIPDGPNRGSWSVNCSCSQAEACRRAYMFMLMFIS